MSNGLIYFYMFWNDTSWHDFDNVLDDDKKFTEDFVLHSRVIFKGMFTNPFMNSCNFSDGSFYLIFIPSIKS